MIRLVCALAAVLAAGAAAALDMPPGARLMVERVSDPDRYGAPIGPYAEGRVPVRQIEGEVLRQVWEIAASGAGPLQIAAPLRAQLEAEGFEIVLDCLSAQCGGFDFRFGTEVLPAPNMVVNLRNFQFLTARLGPSEAPQRVITLLISAGRERTHLQLIEARARSDPGTIARNPPRPEERPAALPAEADPDEAAPAPTPSPSGGDLFASGALVLEGLEFETGATRLGPGPFAALDLLAGYLTANPELRVTLVGHTDTVGPLEGNVRISRERAESVLERLTRVYGIAPDRLSAEGMGYLAPRASNATAGGREANRRVEAILLPAR